MGSKDKPAKEIQKPKKFVPKPLPLRPLVRAIQEAASKDRPNYARATSRCMGQLLQLPNARLVTRRMSVSMRDRLELEDTDVTRR
jgi:hypothetical protein